VTTIDSLKEAFAGEPGQPEVSGVCQEGGRGWPPQHRAPVPRHRGSRAHSCRGHLRALDGVASTRDNLKRAIAVKHTNTPPCIAHAGTGPGRRSRARIMFGFAVKAEAVHAELYQRALEAAEQGKDLAEAQFYACPVCGYIEFGARPNRVPSAARRKTSS